MKKKLLFILSMLMVGTAIHAVPAKRGIWKTFTLKTGQTVQVQLCGDEFLHFWEDKDGNRYSYDTSDGLKPANMAQLRTRAQVMRQQACPDNIIKKSLLTGANGSTSLTRGVSYTGKKKCLILLAQFSDKKFTMNDPKAFYNRVANEPGFSEGNFKGSVADYFKAQSNGKFEMNFDVMGPYTLGEQAYYGKNEGDQQDVNVQAMISGCLGKAASEGIDFSPYDWDGDGEMEMVFVVYAGRGEATGGDVNTIWPHKGRMTNPVKCGNKTLTNYACSNELSVSNEVDGIGTICHEFSHCFGYPDAYDVNYSGLYGMGTWDLMCQGNYNGNGFTPAGYTAYEKYAAGWITPIELKENTSVSGMKPLAEGGDAYIFKNPNNSDEYYLIENRQKKGWDAGLAGSGIIINHIDYNLKAWNYNTPNSMTSGINDHERITLIPADNIKSDKNEENDPWPYGNKNRLANNTTPACNTYNLNTDGTKLMNIILSDMAIAADGTASFTFQNLNKTASEENYIFQETFDKCLGTGGNDGKGFYTFGNPNQFANSAFSPDKNGWTASVQTFKGGFQCARVGKRGATNITFTSPEIKINGDATLTFKAAPYSLSSNKMTVSISNGTVETATFKLEPNKWNECSTKITANGRVKITFASDAFFIDEVCVAEGSTSDISNIMLSEKQVKAYYNVLGEKSNVPFEGLNIVTFTDGTAKKVYVKK
jgi:immune inhibitor A